jgi:23S rRNA (guanosine2251-2'-O)-methyltransferase
VKKIYIALENIRSLYNIGAIFRTCSFFGFENILLVGYSGKNEDTFYKPVLHEKISKTALGSEKDLKIHFIENSDDLIKFARESRLEIIVVEQNGASTPLKRWRVRDKIILVFGNEVNGVSEEVLSCASEIIEIPRYGKHSSLNVTTACAVVLHHITPS